MQIVDDEYGFTRLLIFKVSCLVLSCLVWNSGSGFTYRYIATVDGYCIELFGLRLWLEFSTI